MAYRQNKRVCTNDNTSVEVTKNLVDNTSIGWTPTPYQQKHIDASLAFNIWVTAEEYIKQGSIGCGYTCCVGDYIGWRCNNKINNSDSNLCDMHHQILGSSG